MYAQVHSPYAFLTKKWTRHDSTDAATSSIEHATNHNEALGVVLSTREEIQEELLCESAANNERMLPTSVLLCPNTREDTQLENA